MLHLYLLINNMYIKKLLFLKESERKRLNYSGTFRLKICTKHWEYRVSQWIRDMIKLHVLCLWLQFYWTRYREELVAFVHVMLTDSICVLGLSKHNFEYKIQFFFLFFWICWILKFKNNDNKEKLVLCQYWFNFKCLKL